MSFGQYFPNSKPGPSSWPWKYDLDERKHKFQEDKKQHVDNTMDIGSFEIQGHIFLIDQYFLNRHGHHYRKNEQGHLNFFNKEPNL